MRPDAFAAAACLVLLAGCSSPDGGGAPDATPTPSPPDAGSYGITLSDVPATPLQAGAQFRFNSTITGDTTRASDHIGAHFGNQSTAQPSTAVYAVTCPHTGGNLPGRYTVACTAPQQPGVYYLRGHARITQGDGAQVSWWSSEATFTVAPLQGNLQA